MVGHADLTGEDHAASQPRRSRDTDLRHQQRVLADDRRCGRSARGCRSWSRAPRSCRRRWPGRSWCWRRSRHRPRSARRPPAESCGGRVPSKAKPKPSAPSTAPAMNDDPPAHPDSLPQAHVRVDHVSLADLHAGSDVDQRVQAGAGADHRAALHHARAAQPRRVGSMRASGATTAVRSTPAGVGTGGWKRQSSWIRACCGASHRGSEPGRSRTSRGTRNAPARDVSAAAAVPEIGQERDLVGPGALQRRHPGDDPARITVEARLEAFRELAEREPGLGHRRYGFFAVRCRRGSRRSLVLLIIRADDLLGQVGLGGSRRGRRRRASPRSDSSSSPCPPAR